MARSYAGVPVFKDKKEKIENAFSAVCSRNFFVAEYESEPNKSCELYFTYPDMACTMQTLLLHKVRESQEAGIHNETCLFKGC